MVAQGDRVKIVYADGNITNGPIRSIRGTIIDIDENSITIQRSDGELVIGKSFVVKVENWRDNRRE